MERTDATLGVATLCVGVGQGVATVIEHLERGKNGDSKVGVIGAGTMGHGIAQVCAMAGFEVVLCDIDSQYVVKGLETIQRNLLKGVERGKVAAEVADESLIESAAQPNTLRSPMRPTFSLKRFLNDWNSSRACFPPWKTMHRSTASLEQTPLP